MNNKIHSSFEHGINFKIGHFCVIEENVIVGDNITIENLVLLKKGTHIKDNTFIDSYVRSSGNNLIGNNVTLRYGCTIAKEVIIEDNVFISPNVMTIYSTHKKNDISGTVIRKGAYIGTAAVIGPGVIIGQNVIIGSMSYVPKDCIEPGIYIGAPARYLKSL